MSSKKLVFIDGEVGTTGLQIAERLETRTDIELIRLEQSKRKEQASRREALNRADVAILCLPDDAAREAVSLIDNPNTCVIDASTAHRVADGWVYGFPEYDSQQRERLREAKRISNPGCYAIASIALLHPLVEAGLLPADWPISINAVSGYSGGGKGLIAAFESGDPATKIDATVYDYALTLKHKHVPEILRWGGLAHAPIFTPAVGHYYKGMLVHIPLPLWALPNSPEPEQVHQCYLERYSNERFVNVAELDCGERLERLDPEQLNDTNELRLHLLHNREEQQVVLVAQLDNLGKGASGQAVQTLNLVLGSDESLGL